MSATILYKNQTITSETRVVDLIMVFLFFFFDRVVYTTKVDWSSDAILFAPFMLTPTTHYLSITSASSDHLTAPPLIPTGHSQRFKRLTRRSSSFQTGSSHSDDIVASHSIYHTNPSRLFSSSPSLPLPPASTRRRRF